MHWGYSEEDGPHTWAVNYPLAAGKAQSPINIVRTSAEYDKDLEDTPLQFQYTGDDGYTVVNTGESFKVDLKHNSELEGGPLTGCYRLEQFHFHWGSDDDRGSEHTIDGKAYAAELHLVHWNFTKYNSFSAAVSRPDGLAVVGVMIQAGEENQGFKELEDTLKLVKVGGQSCKIPKRFNPSNLLPEDTRDFWTYHGSLTTPPCYESVQWIVLKEPVQYSSKQLQALRSLKKSIFDNECIQNNFRPPVPVGIRKVRASFSSL